MFGASSTVSSSVVNLSDGYTDKICYLAANTAVIYDKRLRKQTFLQVRKLSMLSGLWTQLSSQARLLAGGISACRSAGTLASL